jgi:hypothetical protein
VDVCSIADGHVEIAKREPVKRRSSVNDESINISGQVVSNGRYVAFQVADIVITTLHRALSHAGFRSMMRRRPTRRLLDGVFTACAVARAKA